MKSGIILLLIAALTCPAYAAADTQTSSTGYTPKDFDQGFQAALEVIKEYGLDDDPAKVRRVNEIGYRVAQRSAPNMPNFSFRIVKMEEPNAFALPGGFIFVTTGMLDLNLNDDELAALLGHEITHVRNEHSRKMAKRQTLMNLLYQALVLGIAFGLKDSGGAYDPLTGERTRDTKAEILQGSEAFGLVFQELLLRGFSRELELEADHEGMIAAARAGFSANGTTELFDKMRQRVYEVPGYGYWMTHPYLDERSEIARVLAPQFETSKNPPDATDFRKDTQQTFLRLLDKKKDEAQKRELRQMALRAYPRGKEADELRSWFIRDAENKENQKEAFFRDYGKLIRLYEENIQEMNQEMNSSGVSKDPQQDGTKLKGEHDTSGPVFEANLSQDKQSNELLEKLTKNLAKLKEDREATIRMYDDVLARQMYDTDTLKRFISNFPDSPRIAEVRFHLAENNRILKKSADAVGLYLQNLSADKDSEWKTKSRQSLLQMIPSLTDLTACYKIQADSKEQDLQKAALDRMNILAQSFDSLQNGYDFRRNYPNSDFEKPVRTQMSKLATDTLNQAKLYQAVGEYQKALDYYNKILRYCSDLPVADQVKDSIVDFQELSAVKGT